MDTLAFSPPSNLSEEEKKLLAVTSFETTSSVFNVTEENNSLSIKIPSYWMPLGTEETVDKLKELIELRSENDIELHVQENLKRGKIFKSTPLVGVVFEYDLSDFDNLGSEILLALKEARYKDLEDMVYRMVLTYDEIVYLSKLIYIPSEKVSFTIASGMYEASDLNSM